MSDNALSEIAEALSSVTPSKPFTERLRDSGTTRKILRVAKTFSKKFGGESLAVAACGRGPILARLAPSVIQKINTDTPLSRRDVIGLLRDDTWTPTEIQASGIVCGDSIFSNRDPGLPGRPGISPQVEERIKIVLEDKSSTLSKVHQRASKRRGTSVLRKSLHFRKSTLWKRHFRDCVSRSKFYDIVRRNHPEFRSREKPTDMCDYCQQEGAIRISLKKLATKKNLEWDYDASSVEMKLAMTSFPPDAADISTFVSKIKEIEALEKHQSIADRQRKVYNEERLHPGGKLVIDFDFKAKSSLPMKTVNVSQDFYSKQAFSHLGFGVYATNFTMNADYVSENLHQEAYVVIACLKDLLARPWIPQTCTEISFWGDVGKHFQNKELCHELLVRIPDKTSFEHVSVNFLCEKHGKNCRDSHFGVITNHLNEFTKAHDIMNLQQLADTLCDIRNTEATVMQYPSQMNRLVRSVEFSLFSSPYCFRRSAHGPLTTPFFSDCESGPELAYTVVTERKQRTPKLAPEHDREAESEAVVPALLRRQSRAQRFAAAHNVAMP